MVTSIATITWHQGQVDGRHFKLAKYRDLPSSFAEAKGSTNTCFIIRLLNLHVLIFLREVTSSKCVLPQSVFFSYQ